MYNKVILIGNLTRDIEMRYASSGTAIGRTGIATNRKWKDQSGQLKEEVTFVDITFFGRTAEIANQYLHKGSKVLIEGRLKLEQWTDNNGGKRSKLSVVVENMKMLGSKQNNQNNQGSGNYQNSVQQNNYNGKTPNQSQGSSQNNEIPDIDIDDEEIPF